MGAWSNTICGSDDACETLDGVDELLNLGIDIEEAPREQVKAALEKVSDAEWVEFFGTQGTEDIAVQVVAYLHAKNGAIMPPGLAKMALIECDADLEDLQDWKEPKERKKHLDALLHAIKHSAGTPVALAE